MHLYEACEYLNDGVNRRSEPTEQCDAHDDENISMTSDPGEAVARWMALTVDVATTHGSLRASE